MVKQSITFLDTKMPALTFQQKAVFNLIDHLHFTQVFIGFMNSHPHLCWYERILSAVEKRINDWGLQEKSYHIAKHYLLGSLEIYLSVKDDFISQAKAFTGENPSISNADFESVTKTTRDFCVAQLFVVAGYNGFDTDKFSAAYEDLISDESLMLTEVPDIVRYRLVECCFAIEFPHGPILVYREMVHLGLIPCAKYSSKEDLAKNYYSEKVSNIVVRAGLVYELKIMRERSLFSIKPKNKRKLYFIEPTSLMTRRYKKELADYYKNIVDDIFSDKEGSSFAVFLCSGELGKREVEMFLKNINKFSIHKRMFTGTQASWLGTLGAFHVAIERSLEDGRAIYCEMNNEGTITESVVKMFKELGFIVSARTLYLRHKDVQEDNYSKIQYYFSVLQNMPTIPPWHCDFPLYETATNFHIHSELVGAV